MPTISDAVEYQTLWITLIEALTHIQSVEKCTVIIAGAQLKRCIGQRLVPVKWADSSGPNDKPDVRQLQRSQLVLSGPGLALSGSSLRSLLVLRRAVHATWPLPTSEVPAASEAVSTVSRHLAEWEAREEDEPWMSLVEAIDHIQIVQRCDSIEALRQLKRELQDGMVRAKWEDSEGPDDFPDPECLKASQLLLIGTGLAPDNVQEIYRPLLVERAAVRELWQLPNYRHKGSRRTVPESADQQRQVSRPASEAQIREALRKIYADPSNNRPNVNVAYDLLRLLLPNARKRTAMSIIKEPEFKIQRRGSGNQPKS